MKGLYTVCYYRTFASFIPFTLLHFPCPSCSRFKIHFLQSIKLLPVSAWPCSLPLLFWISKWVIFQGIATSLGVNILHLVQKCKLLNSPNLAPLHLLHSMLTLHTLSRLKPNFQSCRVFQKLTFVYAEDSCTC